MSLDLVFCMDCTGSMGPYINKAKQSIQNIIKKITENSECKDFLFGLVAYRDHPPQDNTFITKKFEFTNNIETIQSNLNELRAAGGGDGPEALTTALYELNNLNWRNSSTKIVILISDAPPHGLGEYDDGFPNGEPNGYDPIIITKELASKGITIYTVGCEPEINKYKFARAFLISLANLTGGQPIGLSNANYLADVILGSTIEELGITKLLEKVEEETERVKFNFTSIGRTFTDDMVLNEVYTQLSGSRINTPQIKGCNVMRDESEGIIEASCDLPSAKLKLENTEKRALSTPHDSTRTKYAKYDPTDHFIDLENKYTELEYDYLNLENKYPDLKSTYPDLIIDKTPDLIIDKTPDLKADTFTDLKADTFTDLKEKNISVVDDLISIDQVKRLIIRNKNRTTTNFI